MTVRAEECRRKLEDTVNDDSDIEVLRLIPNDWRQLSDIKKSWHPSTNILSTSLEIALQFIWGARMFRELRSIPLAIKERRGEWQKVSPAMTVHVSDEISLLEMSHDCVKDNDIYHIASFRDLPIKPKWLKTLPDGEKIIERIRAFLKRVYYAPKQPVLTMYSKQQLEELRISISGSLSSYTV